MLANILTGSFTIYGPGSVAADSESESEETNSNSSSEAVEDEADKLWFAVIRGSKVGLRYTWCVA